MQDSLTHANAYLTGYGWAKRLGNERCLDNQCCSPLSLQELQQENSAWAGYNFGTSETHGLGSFAGVAEEIGELAEELPDDDPHTVALCRSLGRLAHGVLKTHQKIRPGAEEKAKDAIGDIVVYLADLCNRRGWDLQAIVEETWANVRERDWVRYPANGRSA